MDSYTLDQGESLVRAARSSIELQIKSPLFNPDAIEKGMERIESPDIVAIRIVHYPTKTERGFFVQQGKGTNAIRNVIDVLSTAFKENKIPSTVRELDESVIELHLLAEPMPVTGSYINRLNAFEIGKHGIIIEYGSHRSMLLPVHALEKGLDKRQFLEEACIAAGLPRNYWKMPKVHMYRFDTQAFAEEEPSGNVAQRH